MIFNLFYTYSTYLNTHLYNNNYNDYKKNIVLLGDGFFARGFLQHINFNKFNITQIYKDEFINPQDIMYELQRGNNDLNNKRFHLRDLFNNSHNKIQDEVKSFTYNFKKLRITSEKYISNYDCDYLVIGVGNKKSLKMWQQELNEIINKKKKVDIVGMGPTGFELANILSKYVQVEMFDTLSKDNSFFYVKPENKDKLLEILNKKNIKLNYNMSFNHIYENPIYCFSGAPNKIYNPSLDNFKVDKYLQSITNPNIYIGGDCVDSKEYIKNAQNAYQQGKYVAQRLNQEISMNKEYKYKSNGISLNIGDNKVMIEGHNIVPDGIYPDFIIKLYSIFTI
jgi:NADH dehydrogenase FAD-containing subunit